jgi:hypothetical protein
VTLSSYMTNSGQTAYLADDKGNILGIKFWKRFSVSSVWTRRILFDAEYILEANNEQRFKSYLFIFIFRAGTTSMV